MPHSPKILVVDDDENKRLLIARFLELHFGDARITLCDSGEQAMEHLSHHPIDALITNHSMQPVNGVELTHWARSRFPALPILMVTGNPGIAQEAMNAGATHVMEFARYAEIGPILRRVLDRQ